MMKSFESRQYFWPAAVALFPDKCSEANHDGEKHLAKELGILVELETYLTRSATLDPEMTDELKQILLKLAGPYGKVFLEVLKAQGGIDPKICSGKPT